MTRFGIFAMFSVLAVAPLVPVAAQDLLWTRQAGTSAQEFGSGVTSYGTDNVYIAGSTFGSLGGTNAGSSDAFLARYNGSGALIWTRQMGTTGDDSGLGVAADGAGNIYVAGSTDGGLGGSNAGGVDVFLAKYDGSGALIWTRQVGTTGDDRGIGVAADGAGNIYVAGSTSGSLGGVNAGLRDIVLAAFDTSGSLRWTRQVGTTGDDLGVGVAVDGAGNAYVAGYTNGSLGGTNAGDIDVFLAKYDVSGSLLWERQAGTTAADYVFGVASDGAGNAYITGSTQGNLGGPNAGSDDIFLSKYDALGTPLWTRQTGTTSPDIGYGVAVDGAGNAYVTGFTLGSLGGPNAGATDVFVAKYNSFGTPLWTRQTGTASIDNAIDAFVDDSGNLYISGWTLGSLGGSSAGGNDYFLAKYGPSPCPSDFNQDGFVNGDDFDAFVLVFEAGNVGADFDGNGFVNGDDFDGYVAAFEAGC